jgi:hypothetical protein
LLRHWRLLWPELLLDPTRVEKMGRRVERLAALFVTSVRLFRSLQNSHYCRQPQSEAAIIFPARELAQISRAVVIPD